MRITTRKLTFPLAGVLVAALFLLLAAPATGGELGNEVAPDSTVPAQQDGEGMDGGHGEGPCNYPDWTRGEEA